MPLVQNYTTAHTTSPMACMFFPGEVLGPESVRENGWEHGGACALAHAGARARIDPKSVTKESSGSGSFELVLSEKQQPRE